MQVSTIISGAIEPKSFQVIDQTYGAIKVCEFDIARLKLKLGSNQSVSGDAFLYQTPFQELGGYFYPGMCSVVE